MPLFAQISFYDSRKNLTRGGAEGRLLPQKRIFSVLISNGFTYSMTVFPRKFSG
jgi:hypothetical protein